MVIVSITCVIFIHALMKATNAGDVCDEADEIECSLVYDPVCGLSEAADGVPLIKKYHNICYFTKERCFLPFMHDLRQIPDELCRIKKKKLRNLRVRRFGAVGLTDFGIVGAHQACNHTCPTHCIDTYNPACAQIWSRDMQESEFRPMINHCHIDLFSCAFKLNVTIQPIARCYKNAARLLFMSQIAALKSLRLLDDTPLS